MNSPRPHRAVRPSIRTDLETAAADVLTLRTATNT
jgi:hypothetical protein